MPSKYPCIFCKKPVRNNQNAMLCTSCYKWGHLKCSKESVSFFRSDSDWKCDICLWKELPFSEFASTLLSMGNTTSHETPHNDSIRNDINSDLVKNDIVKLQLQRGQLLITLAEHAGYFVNIPDLKIKTKSFLKIQKNKKK